LSRKATQKQVCPEVGFDTTPGVRSGMFARMPCGWLWVPDLRGRTQILCALQILVGAGLLAMASGQSPEVLDDTPLSLASQLLQGIFGVHGCCVHCRSS
jgi:hypothetical protein